MSNMAFESPLFLAISCFLAGGIWLMLWTRSRKAYMLLTAACWWAFCIYFGMIYVSAGTAPVVTRSEIAPAIRAWGFVVGALVLAGKGMMLAALWRNEARGRRARREMDEEGAGVAHPGRG